MGLDITAYSHLRPVGRHADGGWCEDDQHVHAFAYNDFPDSFRGIPILGTDAFGKDYFIDGGCYAITGSTEQHSFHAGSYSGYSLWRANLAEQFNPCGEEY